jgi:predicted Fe-Mo cluster-binding NifX family protein
MKILFAVENNAGLDSVMDSRFGRAGYFLIYDTDEKKVLSVEENKFKNEAHGVGIKIASFVVESGCRVAIGPQPGPKAVTILAQANVKIIVNHKGTVKEALEVYKEELTV